MAPFRTSIKRLSERLKPCEEWLELIRDLQDPIVVHEPNLHFNMRWADKRDLSAVSALEGFVKETNFMEESLKRGDRCLLLETDRRIIAFAWVTFRDFKLALWYTLKVHPGWSYLVYIFVHPESGRQGIGSYLLGSLMIELRELDHRILISGMYSNWEHSIRLHAKMGFKIHRRLTQCRLLNIFPYPPREEVVASGGSQDEKAP